MPKYGVNLKIDVTKIDKERLFKGEKGTYLDLTTFIDTENQSQYGDNGTISQAIDQDERDQGVKMPIIGNARVFWEGNSQENHQPSQPQNQPAPQSDDDIPF